MPDGNQLPLSWCVLSLALPLAAANAAPAQRVEVVNLPEVQAIAGDVAVTRPVPQTELDVRRALVSPVDLTDTANLSDAGVLETRGFSYLTLSFAGTLQGQGERGSVGVVLVPDVPEVLAALRSFGVLQFALRSEAPVPPSQSGVFSSESATFRLAFPRYRVLLWNSSPKSAEVTIWAYLGTS
jgi:hypothetical protein